MSPEMVTQLVMEFGKDWHVIGRNLGAAESWLVEGG